jgi:hypothetical protein
MSKEIFQVIYTVLIGSTLGLCFALAVDSQDPYVISFTVIPLLVIGYALHERQRETEIHNRSTTSPDKKDCSSKD